MAADFSRLSKVLQDFMVNSSDRSIRILTLENAKYYSSHASLGVFAEYVDFAAQYCDGVFGETERITMMSKSTAYATDYLEHQSCVGVDNIRALGFGILPTEYYVARLTICSIASLRFMPLMPIWRQATSNTSNELYEHIVAMLNIG